MRFLVILVGFVLAASPDSWACSLVWVPISVGSSFRVKVSGAVKGLRLTLAGDRGGTLSAVTGDDGIAEFDNVPLGAHHLSVDPDDGFGTELDVKPNAPKNAVVPMQWPSKEPIRVRSLSGTMRGPHAILGQLKQPVLSLELMEGVSGRVLSNISTTDRGQFDFGKVAAGLYFIRVIGGLISVAVDPSAPAQADKLDLSLISTSC